MKREAEYPHPLTRKQKILVFLVDHVWNWFLFGKLGFLGFFFAAFFLQHFFWLHVAVVYYVVTSVPFYVLEELRDLKNYNDFKYSISGPIEQTDLDQNFVSRANIGYALTLAFFFTITSFGHGEMDFKIGMHAYLVAVFLEPWIEKHLRAWIRKRFINEFPHLFVSKYRYPDLTL